MNEPERISIPKVAPKAIEAMLQLENATAGLGLERPLYELIKIRASQINGCAHCIDMHTKDARAAGETEQRIYALDAWRETPFFTERERAALALTEAITLITQGQVPEEVWAQAAAQFDEKELGALVMAAVTINAWNRIAISSRTLAGTYEPRQHTS
ncbi:MAG TPA: carboxymuconolactone decarboxylase family protein [Vulgatibacter sp.]|nr:carboxymuconolactone decarboxylase family protein [Vulgatibacter sp.]